MKRFAPLYVVWLLLLAGACSQDTPAAATEDSSASAMSKPGLVHNVHFWLKPELTEAERADFLRGVRSLADIAAVDYFLLGPPASTEAREVVDNSFSYALIVWFEDVAAQDAYQIDPIHLKFVEECQQYWEKVVVRDNLVE